MNVIRLTNIPKTGYGLCPESQKSGKQRNKINKADSSLKSSLIHYSLLLKLTGSPYVFMTYAVSIIYFLFMMFLTDLMH